MAINISTRINAQQNDKSRTEIITPIVAGRGGKAKTFDLEKTKKELKRLRGMRFDRNDKCGRLLPTTKNGENQA